MKYFIPFAILGLFCAAAIGGDACGPAREATCGAGGCGQACHASGASCPRCGCKMMCHVECYTKEIKKTEWVVKCEPYCAPLPGCGRDCCECEGECSRCKCDPCAVELAKAQVPPKCGPVKERKVLEKKEIVCKVPSYRCVPTCPSCGCTGQPKEIDTPKPEKAPAKTAQLKDGESMAPLPPLAQMSYKK